ncbi:hypothetical protein VTL71DRAFT_10331 [Oculimacula yallundae]|uniref:Protein kinase domain-containing protein n=1 Tax=Oculimacula yallundae TaxID=86028 RepID=A0ABR4CTW0_9HELO
MELSASLESFICPLAPFLTFTDTKTGIELCRVCQSEYDERESPNTSSTIWSLSSTNPQNRLNAFYPSLEPQWKIDGCTAMGRQLFAVPRYMGPDLPVKYIDIIIPCQSRQPHGLRRALQSGSLFSMSSQAVNKLDICHYIAQCLEIWSSRHLNFEILYRSLPFGSKFWLEGIVSRVEEAQFRIVPNVSLTQSLLSIEALQAMWKLPSHSWPATIGLNDLRYVSRLNENVSLVQLPVLDVLKQFVFKTNLRSARHMYHELKLLLSMDDHKNIISKPLFLVSLDSTSKPSKVVGFLLEYYSFGTLHSVLESRNTPNMTLKLKWATQVTETMRTIIESPARYYSDLKPDNLLFSGPSCDLMFIDFDQGGNWDTFMAPEIMYFEWMKKLSKHEDVPKQTRTRYLRLMDTRYHVLESVPSEQVYSNPSKGYNDTWNSLSPRQQEAAMVYSVGKILWCIFEECSHTRNSFEEKYEMDIDLEFPRFANTPELIRDLIQQCTSGAPELILEEQIKLVKKGTLLVTRIQAANSCYDVASPLATIETAKELWTSRVQMMEAYAEAQSRFAQCTCNKEDEVLLGFPMRPSLVEILEALDRQVVIEEAGRM